MNFMTECLRKDPLNFVSFRCVEDSTYNVITPTGDNTKRKSFSVEAFNFVTDGTAAVYIHGVVKICDTAESYYAT